MPLQRLFRGPLEFDEHDHDGRVNALKCSTCRARRTFEIVKYNVRGFDERTHRELNAHRGVDIADGPVWELDHTKDQDGSLV